MKRVEGVEEFFLRLLAPRQRLNVVDQKKIALLSVAGTKLVHLVMLQRANVVVGEKLSRDVDDAGVRALGMYAMRDGVYEVRLAKPGAAANEERVVAPAP